MTSSWRNSKFCDEYMCNSGELVTFSVTHHYDDVIMTMLASQITSLMVVYSIVYSGVNQRKHQSSALLAFVREIHRGPVNFPHKWPVTRKMFPLDDVIMMYDIPGSCCNRADSRFAPSQWERALLCNDVSHWLGASLESALCNVYPCKF